MLVNVINILIIKKIKAFFRYLLGITTNVKTLKTMLSDKITDHEVATKVNFCFSG
jgi:hypothetical protein